MSAVNDVATLQKSFGDKIVKIVEFRDEQTVYVELGSLHDLLKKCKAELGYVMVIDISSVDHFGDDPRFEIVYEIASLDDSKHLRIKVAVDEEQEVPTATDIWLGADWHEREVYDMMGIRFTDHPNMKRILMWEGYPFYPLRKDFPLAGRPSEMPDVAFSGTAPLEGGPFVTSSGSSEVSSREPRAKVVD